MNIEATAPMKYFGTIHPGIIAESQPEILRVDIREARLMVVDQVGEALSGSFGVEIQANAKPGPGN